MTRPVQTWISGLVVLALVSFGQLCATQPQISPAAASTDEHRAVERAESQAAGNHDESACPPGECGGDAEGCPSKAGVCCSTWGPPTRAGIIEPPIISSDFLTDLQWPAAILPLRLTLSTQPVEIIRPPGPTEATLLIVSAVSRRGPPNFS